MSKRGSYRIKHVRGRFYAQRRGWLFWRTLPRFQTPYGPVTVCETRQAARLVIEKDKTRREAWAAEPRYEARS